MNYNEVHIRQADAALKLLHETQGLVDGHRLWQVMGPPKAEYMRYQLSEVLHLASRRIDSYTITEEGEKAYAMGFKAYMEERERKAKEPVQVREVKSESEKRLAKWLTWSGIAGGVAAGIDILLRLLGLLK